MENTTVRDSDSDSDTNTSESHPGPHGAFNTSMAQVAVCSSNEIPSEDKDRKNALTVSLKNQIVKDSNSDSDSNSCESKPSPEDTGTTAVVEIAVCSSGETLNESSLSETSEEKKEINGKDDYSMIKDKDDLSITAEVGSTSSKSPDDKDDPLSPVSLENQIVKDSNSDSDSNSCESKPSPEDTTAVEEIAVYSSAETLNESSLSETAEEKKEINGKKDYSMIKDKDDPQDDLSITAEVGCISSKSPDNKDNPLSPVSLENQIVKDSNSDSDYSMIKDKDDPQDDLSITAEVGGTSSKSPDDKDNPPSSKRLENSIVRDPVCDFYTNSCGSKPSPDDTGTTTVVQIAECSSGETHKGFAMSTSSDEEINEKNDHSVTKGKHTSTRLCEDNDGQKEDMSTTAEVGGTSSKSSTQRDDPRKPATTTVSFFSNPVSYVWDKVKGTKHKDKGIKRSGKPDYYDELGFQNKHSRRPGKPTCSDSGSDYIQLAWKVPDDKNVLYYETKYKQAQKELWNKESVMTRDTSPSIYIRGLLQDTEYEFKVRGHYKDDEGEYSEKSESIRTPKSPALSVRQKCMKLQDGEPSFYKVPLTENKKARNEKFKTRKCEFGSSNLILEKTIMMIGATGSGKSTLIDGMLNHLLGVKWEDDIRFKIIDLMSEEEARKGHQTESQTDWITSYRVHPMTKDVKFICNIIDTPGFGDTRGIHRDHQLVDQIRAFFNTKGAKGIETIDAICFVTQAPLARLTHTQRYIYDSILSIFGKDMEENIVAMVTFADGKEPPVLNALEHANIPIKMHFIFNNSALFEPNSDAKCSKFGKMFWEMGFLSYQEFFTFLPHMKTQSLQLTAKVLNKREQLNTTVIGLLPQIDMGLCELATMRTERELIEKFDREIMDNQNFTYEVDEFQQVLRELDPGSYVTHCNFCHMTCHYPCRYSNNKDKIRCSAMDAEGKCTVCPKNCNWRNHENTDFRIEIKTVKVQRTYEEMKKKLDIAKEAKVSKQHVIRRLEDAFKGMKNGVLRMIDQVRICGNYLRNNAIKSNPLTEVEYLDVLIESAQQEKKSGFQDRVSMLKSLKRAAELKAKSEHLTAEQMLEEFGLHDMGM